MLIGVRVGVCSVGLGFNCTPWQACSGKLKLQCVQAVTAKDVQNVLLSKNKKKNRFQVVSSVTHTN